MWSCDRVSKPFLDGAPRRVTERQGAGHVVSAPVPPAPPPGGGGPASGVATSSPRPAPSCRRAVGEPSPRRAPPRKQPSGTSPSEERALSPYHSTTAVPGHPGGGAGLLPLTLTFKTVSCTAWKTQICQVTVQSLLPAGPGLPHSVLWYFSLCSRELVAGACDVGFSSGRPSRGQGGPQAFPPRP